MILWVLYDIAEDKARTRVAKHCKQAGLYRVQYSVFLGKINATERDELRLEIEGLIDTDSDKVYLFTLTKAELKQAILLGQAFDKKLVTDQVKAMFF